MRPRHTRHNDPELGGPTTQTSIRVPGVQYQAIQSAIEDGIPGIRSFTDVVTDALWLWLYETRNVRTVTHVRTAVDTQIAITEAEAAVAASRAAVRDVVDQPRPDSNGRPAWKDVDPALLEET